MTRGVKCFEEAQKQRNLRVLSGLPDCPVATVVVNALVLYLGLPIPSQDGPQSPR